MDYQQLAQQIAHDPVAASGTVYLGLEDAVKHTLHALLAAMFPRYYGGAIGGQRPAGEDAVLAKRAAALAEAHTAILTAFSYVMEKSEAEAKADALLEALPGIYGLLKTDLCAAYEGDPAAHSADEIILSYPAFRAIFSYRIAHELYLAGVPIISRMMTEYAHERTGIDIHPGAQIGRYFFIDHGTGVVIGETTVIGEHVKLYQHVTLGAKSFEVGPDGTPVKGIKRHPNIGNNVVIYAGATILGGDTIIGDNCVIGSSVWLTHSVEPGRIVTVRAHESRRTGEC